MPSFDGPVRAWIITISTTAAMSGCGSSASPADEARPDVMECSRNWQVLHRNEAPKQFVYSDGLAHSDGQLYQAVSGVGIVTLPATGGPARTIVDGEVYRYWVDHDQLVYIRRGLTSGQMYTQPLASGEATSVPYEVVHTGLDNGFPAGYALHEEALYWLYFQVYPEPTTLTLWRTARGDGSHAKQVELPATYAYNVFRVGDRLVTEHRTVTGVHLWSFPLGGGTAPQLLPPDNASEVLGMSADGRAILAWPYGNEASRQGWPHLTLWQVDGTASTPWWTNRPRGLLPLQVWDDGVGGFYAAAVELTTEDARHLTVWSVDSAGIGKRLACDPEVRADIVGAAVGSDAIYLTLREIDSPWRIVRVGADVTP